MIFRVKFQSMYFYLFFLDGQLQPFTTVTHAKESSHNSSGSGVEVARGLELELELEVHMEL